MKRNVVMNLSRSVRCVLAACVLAHSSAALAEEAASASGTPAAADALQDIVVTAQRREERVTDVPISITALSGEDLASSGITSTLNLSQVTPALNYAVQGVFSQPTIRGIGSTGQGIGDNPNVATYVDGVFQPAQYGGIFDFNNIERIEVLKGPQGTLFGRNATGGAIQIITRDPSTEFGGNLQVGFAEHQEKNAKLYLTGGSGIFAADVAALYVEDGGYIRDIARNDNVGERTNKTVRTKMKLTPSDQLSLTLIGTYSDRGDASVISGYNLDGNSATGVANPSVPLAVEPYTTSQSIKPFNDVRQRGVSLRVDYDFGPASLTSISAYEKMWNRVLLDTDGSPVNAALFDSTSTSKALMQEVNLASNGDQRLDWVTGLFYYDDAAGQDPYFFNGLKFVKASVDTQAYAAFGEVSYDVTDRLNVIAGVRYSHEKKSVDTRLFAPFGTARQQDEKTWSDVTPRVSVRYALTDDSNVYATFSQGFKSGVYNAAVVGQPAVDPETVDAFEVGYKATTNGGLSMSLAAYYYDYKDIQVSAYVAGSNTVNLLQNAASAEIYGIDGELLGRFTDRLTVRLGGAWTHARYKNFEGAILLLPNPGGNGNRQISGDASGKEMIRTPEYTLNAGVDYEFPVAGGWTMKVSGNLFRSAGYFWDPGNIIPEGAYTLANLRAAATTPTGRVTYTAYAENAFDEEYGIYVASSGRGNRKVLGRPRTVGFSVAVNF